MQKPKPQPTDKKESSSTSGKSSLEHFPNDSKWEFDQSVSDCFDDMLERSIPGYRHMRGLCDLIGQSILLRAKDMPVVVDLGSSHGGAVEWFVSEGLATYCYEKSEAMRNELKRRYGHLPNVDISGDDLRCYGSSPGWHPPANLILSVLTLQFIPTTYRQQILDGVYQNLKPTGGFILVEKVISPGSWSTYTLEALYHQRKRSAGYTTGEIVAKRAALENVLVPLTMQSNIDMLKQAGFKDVDVFWRNLNFCGIVAVK